MKAPTKEQLKQAEAIMRLEGSDYEWHRLVRPTDFKRGCAEGQKVQCPLTMVVFLRREDRRIAVTQRGRPSQRAVISWIFGVSVDVEKVPDDLVSYNFSFAAQSAVLDYLIERIGLKPRYDGQDRRISFERALHAKLLLDKGCGLTPMQADVREAR